MNTCAAQATVAGPAPSAGPPLTPEAMAGLVAAGQIDNPHVITWLARGFSAFDRARTTGNPLQLERCLRLPRSRAKHRQGLRNAQLLRAGLLLGLDQAGTLLPSVVIRLQAAWSQFAERGPWRQWQEQDDAPAGAGELEQCLFLICRSSDGKVLSLKQIERVLALGVPDISGAGNVWHARPR